MFVVAVILMISEPVSSCGRVASMRLRVVSFEGRIVS